MKNVDVYDESTENNYRDIYGLLFVGFAEFLLLITGVGFLAWLAFGPPDSVGSFIAELAKLCATKRVCLRAGQGVKERAAVLAYGY